METHNKAVLQIIDYEKFGRLRVRPRYEQCDCREPTFEKKFKDSAHSSSSNDDCVRDPKATLRFVEVKKILSLYFVSVVYDEDDNNDDVNK